MDKKYMYLDDATLKQVRAAISQRRQKNAYEPEKWSVSPFNRDPKALGVTAPGRPIVRDITIRTAEQVIGLGLTEDEKVALGDLLAQAKVPAMQIDAHMDGLGMKHETLKRLVKVIRDKNPEAELSIFVWTRNDIEFAVQMGLDKVQFGQTCIPEAVRGFIYGAVWEGVDWKSIRVADTVERQIGRMSRLVEIAKSAKMKISVGINQCSYCNEEYIRQFVPPIVNAGADEVTLYDSCHGMGPEGWRYLCSLVKSAAPSCTIGMHCHNDFGLGTASCISAYLGGATYLEATVNGLGGPGVGQPDLAELVASLEVLYGRTTGIQLEYLTPLSQLAADVSHRPISSHKPITGEDAWQIGGFDEMIWLYSLDPLFPLPVNPEIFGNELKMEGEIGVASGEWSLFFKLKELGLQVDKDKYPAIKEALRREIRLRKRKPTNSELAKLVHNVTA